MQNTVLVDTGFLVALFDAGDPLHEGAKNLLVEVLRPERARLITVWPTIVETCFFLNPRGKTALLEWINRGAVYLRHIETADIPAIIGILDRYAEHSVDVADACLVWLASMEKSNRVLTTDRRDFDMFRTPNGKPFERVWVSP